MTLIATFLVQAVAGFALGLAVAALVGPDAFGRYATGLSVAVLLNTVLFEWLRLSAARFTSEAEEPGTRATLDRLYAAAAGALVLAGTAALAGRIGLGLSPGLLAATALTGLGMGLVDYRAALARAQFRDAAYARLTLSRTVAGFALALAAAWAFAEPALVLVGSALGLLLACLVAGPAPAGEGSPARKDLARAFARYAVPLVAANALYQLLPVLNRAALAGAQGFEEAGVFALAGEATTKLFLVAGTALDLVLFQLAVRAEALHGREAAERRIAANAALVTAALLPAAAGLWLILPAFEAALVPAAFHGRLSAHLAWLIPGTLVFALLQYAVNPAFQIRRRTGPVILAALAATAVDGVLLLVLPTWLGPTGAAAAQAGGWGAGFLALAALALRTGALRLPWRDLAGAALATGLMVAMLLPLRGAGLVHLLALPVLGLGIYAAGVLALDVAGARAWAVERWRRRGLRGVPAE